MVDRWKPLLAIANAVGGQWSDYVRRAMDRAIRRDQAFNADTRVLLDIRRIFDDRRERNPGGKFADCIMATELAEALYQEVSGKSAYADIASSGNARSQWLADRLDEWEITSRRPRKLSAAYPGAGQRSRFFFREDFEGHWSRHGIDDARAREDDLSEDFPPGFVWNEPEAARSGPPNPEPETSQPRSGPPDPGPETSQPRSGPPDPEPEMAKTAEKEGVDQGGPGSEAPHTYDQYFIWSRADPPGPKSNFDSYAGEPRTPVHPGPPSPELSPYPDFGEGAFAHIHPVHRVGEALRLRVKVDESGRPTWLVPAGVVPPQMWVNRLVQHLRRLLEEHPRPKPNGAGA